jgi:hypothetical protein
MGRGQRIVGSSSVVCPRRTFEKTAQKAKEQPVKERIPGIADMSEEQFKEWVYKRSRLPLAVRGHSFVMKSDDVITVDGGKFVYEEALQLVRMLNSRSPFAQVSANVMIWERNGILRSIVLVLIAIIIVVVIFLARR